MGFWSLLAAILYGGVFALFTFWRVDVVDSQTARGIIAAFLLGLYCGVVTFGTSDEKRSLSLPGQTVLGVALACAIAALFDASSEGYIVAVLVGLILGYTADKWVAHVDFT
jgi:hypothetical protein